MLNQRLNQKRLSNLKSIKPNTQIQTLTSINQKNHYQNQNLKKNMTQSTPGEDPEQR